MSSKMAQPPSAPGGGSFLLGLPDVLAEAVFSADGDADVSSEGKGESSAEQIEEDTEANLQKKSMAGTSDQRPTADEMLPPKRIMRAKSTHKVKGGRAPSSKPIKVDVDEEDQIILDMKKAGYDDERIAKKLVEEGLTSYKPKSVHCRYLRLVKKKQQYEEALLDENLTDWHEGEDDLLEAAVEKADERYVKELAKLEQLRWTWTAQEINKTPSTRQRFSAQACRKRFETLQDGTARIPPELDPDREGRAREDAQRLADYKQKQEEKRKQAAADAAEKNRIKKEMSAKVVAARQRKEMKIRDREQKKQAEENFRLAKAQACETAKMRREAALRAHRDQRRYEEHKHRVIQALHKRLRKEAEARLRKKVKFAGLPEGSDIPAEPKKRYQFQNSREEIAQSIDQDIAATEAAIQARAQQFTGEASAVQSVETANPSTYETSHPIITPSTVMEDKEAAELKEDPRNMCTLSELQDILRSRRMILNRMKESKAVVITRLRAEDKDQTIEQLKGVLLAKGAPVTGPKDVLLRRVAEEEAKTSARYKNKFQPIYDEKGKKIIVKPVKVIRTRFAERYNARASPSESGVEEVAEVAKISPGSKTPANPRKKLSREYVYDSEVSNQIERTVADEADNVAGTMDLNDDEA